MSQVTVIIHAEAPVIGPYMSRAMATTQIQHASGSPIRMMRRLRRGRERADSTTVRSFKVAALCQKGCAKIESLSRP